MESAARGHVARADVRRQQGTHAAQQKPCRRHGSAHLAGAEGAQTRVRDEKIESRAFAPIVCAWCGGDTGKLSGRKIRTWARDTGCAVRAAYRGEWACAGRASTSRGAAYIRSRVPCALSMFQRSDAGILSLSYRPAVAPRAPSDGLPRRSVHLFRCAPQLLIPVSENCALARAIFRNGNEELGRAPVPSGAARSSGGSALILAIGKLQRRFGRGQLVWPDSVSAVSCSYPASRGAES